MKRNDQGDEFLVAEEPWRPAVVARAGAVSGMMGAGLVMFCIFGMGGEERRAEITPNEMVQALEAGLPFKELLDLQGALEVPTERLAPMLGLSKATLHRHKGAKSRLPVEVSDRVVRYARLLGLARQTFEDLDEAKLWLKAPQYGLGGAVPLQYAQTEVGAREVEHLLGRIAYAVYS
jgi:putative toxin-antitoxin system antitoxin component (TIGR02293 family)